MKKLLFFLQDGVGGAERVSVFIGKSLPKDNCNIVFVLVDRGSATSISDFIPDEFKVIRIPNNNPFKMMFQLVRIIYNEKPHVVFSSAMYFNTKILLWSWMFPNVRFVIRCENYLFSFNSMQQKMISITYCRADAIIAQTKEMKDELAHQLGIKETKIHVLQNPVDTEMIDRMLCNENNPYPEDGLKHYVASGRFAYQKGYDLLIKAFWNLVKIDKNVSIYIIGDIEYEEGKIYKEIQLLTQEYGIEQHVHFIGYLRNPYPFIRYADCFVLSSRWEGLPNVMIEALYLGTPVAAFKCIPIIERIVNEGENGYLADAENVCHLSESMHKAVSLGRIKSTYDSANSRDFESILLGTDGAMQ